MYIDVTILFPKGSYIKKYMSGEQMKKKIKFYICDDDNNALEKTKHILNLHVSDKYDYLIFTFQNGEDLLNYCEKNCPDVVFLDIDMPTMTGFEVAERLQTIKKNVLIIFITSYEDKVYQSWEYQPFWFVRKNHIEDLNIVLPKLFAKMEQMQKETVVKLVSNNSVTELDLDNVVYIESYKHDIILHDKNGGKATFRCRISDAEAQLLDHYIVRIQKGILVNLRFVSRVTSRNILLTDGSVLSLGRDRIEDVKNKFMLYVRGM